MRAPKRILISARILVGRTQDEVAKECGLAKKTVHRAEIGAAGSGAVEALMSYYQRLGIRFIEPDGGEGWGVMAKFLTQPYEHDGSGRSEDIASVA